MSTTPGAGTTPVPPPRVGPVVPPMPIESFNNSALLSSVQKALASVEPGHGNAVLDVDNKGAGVMVVHKTNGKWAVVAGGRYNFEDKGIHASLAVSW